MSNPVLVELTRGDLVESVHTGALAVARPNGELLLSVGDIGKPIFPRSAIKSMQAIPVIETGAADRYSFGGQEIAISCASHSGTPAHADLSASMLARAGLDVTALGCGAHDPIHELSAKEMFKAGKAPSALHNNCSGKHSGMACTCAHCGDPVAGYLDINHPHQQRIAKVLHDFCGDGFDIKRYGIDGCSAPNWAIPLKPLAKAFAQIVTGDGLSATRRATCERITAACMAHSDMVAGPGRMDTEAMTALGGKLFMKTGAEGVYCGGFPSLGIGFALKIDDGNKRASEAVTAGLIHRLLGTSEWPGTALGPFKNFKGTHVGDTRLAESARKAIEGLKQ